MNDRDVKAPLTNKKGRYVETREYVGMLRRALKALTRRVGQEADVEALPDMLALEVELATSITRAVHGLRQAGYSWAEIGQRCAMTRQGAQQRWGAAVAQLEAQRLFPVS
jgi:hypothetical protein